MISSKVVDLGRLIFHHFQHSVEKSGVFPFPATRLFELPAVDDVADEIQLVAGIGFEEGVQLGGFATAGAEVNVRNENGIPALLLHESLSPVAADAANDREAVLTANKKSTQVSPRDGEEMSQQSVRRRRE
mgnify:CR=1 FL=1